MRLSWEIRCGKNRCRPIAAWADFSDRLPNRALTGQKPVLPSPFPEGYGRTNHPFPAQFYNADPF